MTLTLATAQALLELGVRSAEAEGAEIAITVLDERGVLTGVVRMDRAVPASAQASHAKARTAWLFSCATEQLSAFGPGIASASDEPICTFAGGVPLVARDRVAGAVGVSGGPEPTDARIALLLAEEFGRVRADERPHTEKE